MYIYMKFSFPYWNKKLNLRKDFSRLLLREGGFHSIIFLSRVFHRDYPHSNFVATYMYKTPMVSENRDLHIPERQAWVLLILKLEKEKNNPWFIEFYMCISLPTIYMFFLKKNQNIPQKRCLLVKINQCVWTSAFTILIIS